MDLHSVVRAFLPKPKPQPMFAVGDAVQIVRRATNEIVGESVVAGVRRDRFVLESGAHFSLAGQALDGSQLRILPKGTIERLNAEFLERSREERAKLDEAHRAFVERMAELRKRQEQEAAERQRIRREEAERQALREEEARRRVEADRIAAKREQEAREQAEADVRALMSHARLLWRMGKRKYSQTLKREARRIAGEIEHDPPKRKRKKCCIPDCHAFRISGERFCKQCRKSHLAALAEAGYLDRISRPTPARPPDAREDVRETKHGVD